MVTLQKKGAVSFLFSISIAVLSHSCNHIQDDKSIPFEPIVEMYDYNVHEKLFDDDWRFFRGDAETAENPSYDDSGWRILDLPHDWSIEDLEPSGGPDDAIDPEPAGPFDPKSPGDISTGFTLGGIGWYRKHFSLPAEQSGRIVHILFDGVYMNADFWINGIHLGNHPYGYTPFSFDITPYLRTDGKENVLAVRVANEGRNSRWYSGSGIYRHVWLSSKDPLFLDRWGLYVTTPTVNEEHAEMNLSARVINYYDQYTEFEVIARILDPDGKETGEGTLAGQLDPGASEDYDFSFEFRNPALWNLDSPSLYLAQIRIIRNGKIVDQLSTTFGLRNINFSVDKGFQLNGTTILLKGANMHHDNGPLGAAAIDRAEYRRVELMKSFGFNAIRTSHNPPSRQFLDACDQLGMLVMDEAFDQWQRPKNPDDYNLYFDEWWEKDIEAMVLRDRNHPSVIIWSIGNEVNERADSSGLVLTSKLKAKIKSLDNTRPVTAAICGFWDHPGREWEDTAPAFELLDVAGYNYQWQQYEHDHQLYPQRIILGTESVAMDVFENWTLVETYPWVIGDFVWTGMDYLGEAGIGNALLDGEEKGWPWFNAYCGDIDICGFKKPQSYYRDVIWDISKLEIAVHAPVPAGRKEVVSFWGWPDERQSWNWPGQEGEYLNVSVYSKCDSVAIELNGQNQGILPITDTMNCKTSMAVMYQPGELVAKGYIDGNIVVSRSLVTTGSVHRISLVPDRTNIQASSNELSYINVEAVDEEGRRVPDQEVTISFKIEGPGTLAGIGNGNPVDIKSFQRPYCRTFRGRCLVIIRAEDNNPGQIRITATSGDMTSAATIDVLPRMQP